MLETGNIVLFRKNDTFISKAIAAFTGSSYTHVGIISTVKDDELIMAEALAEGFTLSKYDLTMFKQKVDEGIFLVRSPRKQLHKPRVKETILKYLGRPYGYLDILFIALSKLTGKRLLKGCADKLICSEAVARVLYESSNKRIDFEKEFNKPYSYVTPDDLFMSKQLKTVYGGNKK